MITYFRKYVDLVDLTQCSSDELSEDELPAVPIRNSTPSRNRLEFVGACMFFSYSLLMYMSIDIYCRTEPRTKQDAIVARHALQHQQSVISGEDDED